MSRLFVFVVVFFKQKTAYEMRISDWSSDVCSSDLVTAPDDVTDNDVFQFKATAKAEETPEDAECDTENNVATDDASAYIYGEAAGEPTVGLQEIGRASCR